MPELNLITVASALVGSCIGAILTHFGYEQRERFDRQYLFKNDQITKLYGPMIAIILDLKAHWELLDHMQYESALEARKHKLSGDELLDFHQPIHSVHKNTFKYQYQKLGELRDIAKETFYLAEPDTQIHIRYLFRFCASYDAVMEQGSLSIDRTGIPIPSAIEPFPPALLSFFDNIEHNYNAIRKDMSLSQKNLIQRTAKYIQNKMSLLPKPPSFVPLIQVNKLVPRWGPRTELNPVVPGNLPANTRQYRIPLNLLNSGTTVVEEYFLEVIVPSAFLVPSVQYSLAVERNDNFTRFHCSHKIKSLRLMPGESGDSLSLDLTITPTLQIEHADIPDTIYCAVGLSQDSARSFELSLTDLQLFVV